MKSVLVLRPISVLADSSLIDCRLHALDRELFLAYILRIHDLTVECLFPQATPEEVKAIIWR